MSSTLLKPSQENPLRDLDPLFQEISARMAPGPSGDNGPRIQLNGEAMVAMGAIMEYLHNTLENVRLLAGLTAELHQIDSEIVAGSSEELGVFETGKGFGAEIQERANNVAANDRQLLAQSRQALDLYQGLAPEIANMMQVFETAVQESKMGQATGNKESKSTKFDFGTPLNKGQLPKNGTGASAKQEPKAPEKKNGRKLGM